MTDEAVAKLKGRTLGVFPYAEDYRKMVEDGLLLTDAEPFEELITRCAKAVS